MQDTGFRISGIEGVRYKVKGIRRKVFGEESLRAANYECGHNYLDILHLDFFIHRRAAKCAKKSQFMFAVERPRPSGRDASNGKHKEHFT